MSSGPSAVCTKFGSSSSTSRSICVLINNEARTRMLDKDRGDAGADAAIAHNTGYLIRDLVGSLAPGLDGDAAGVSVHDNSSYSAATKLRPRALGRLPSSIWF